MIMDYTVFFERVKRCSTGVFAVTATLVDRHILYLYIPIVPPEYRGVAVFLARSVFDAALCTLTGRLTHVLARTIIAQPAAG